VWLLLTLAALGALPAAAPPPPRAEVDPRRVEISATFLGRDLFLYGQVVAGTRYVLAVMEGPPIGSVRLLEKGRVALFWLGVRQYRLDGVPAVYLVNVSCPSCKGLAACRHTSALEECNRLLLPQAVVVGPDGIAARARVSSLSGPLRRGEAERVVQGFWALQTERKLYGLRTNAIRLNAQGAFYHAFTLPACAPDGRYRVTTYFLGDNGLLGTESNDVFVRKTGMVESLSRLAARRPAAYGALTVLIAVAAGWLAGTLFKRGGH
jgi:Putative transmembrane protein (Alph_Pro_TM)